MRGVREECSGDLPTTGGLGQGFAQTVAGDQSGVAVAERDDAHTGSIACVDESRGEDRPARRDNDHVDPRAKREDGAFRHHRHDLDVLEVELGREGRRSRLGEGEQDAHHGVDPTGTTDRTEPPVIAASTSATSARSITTSTVVASLSSIPSASTTELTITSPTRMRGAS